MIELRFVRRQREPLTESFPAIASLTLQYREWPDEFDEPPSPIWKDVPIVEEE